MPTKQTASKKQLTDLLRQLTASHQQVTDLQRQQTASNKQLTDLQRQQTAINQQLSDLLRQLAASNKQVTDLPGHLRARDQQVTDLQRQQTASNKQLTDLQRQQTAINKQLTDLQRQQTASHKQLTDRLEQLTASNAQATDLQEKLTASKERVNYLERQLETRNQQVSDLSIASNREVTDLTRQSEASSKVYDWVISRDEIKMTGNVLGVGGWGKVESGTFRGYKVAVKQMDWLVVSSRNRDLFEREMTIAARCCHPCMLLFIGATNDEGRPLLVTELMESSLRALLERETLKPADLSAISLDVAHALNYLHKSDPPIIHRDISSSNVLLWRHGDQWRGKVSDYGVANFMLKYTRTYPGAQRYGAPETGTRHQSVKVKFNY